MGSEMCIRDSIWTYLSQSSSGRSYRRPLGNRSLPFVVDANTMMARVAVMLVFSACLQLFFLHERPVTSVCFVTPFMFWLRGMVCFSLDACWRELFTCLGAFGHETCKPAQHCELGRKSAQAVVTRVAPETCTRLCRTQVPSRPFHLSLIHI